MLSSTDDFIQTLNTYKPHLQPNNILVSFDVESLFTNVPLDQIIDIATDRVYSKNSQATPPFDRNIFSNLLKLATAGVFSFQNFIFRQVDGVTMGNPLGPTLANLFMSSFEYQWQNYSFSPSVYCRYIDDIFCIFKNDSDHSLFLTMLNQQHTNLKFTTEVGYKQINFLDVQVLFDELEIITSVFRKPTFTGLLLNFRSHCPFSWKRGLVFGSLHRFAVICSSWRLFDLEVDKFFDILKHCGYPKKFLLNCLNKQMSVQHDPDRKNNHENKKPTNFIQIPYFGYPSIILSKKLKKTVH